MQVRSADKLMVPCFKSPDDLAQICKFLCSLTATKLMVQCDPAQNTYMYKSIQGLYIKQGVPNVAMQMYPAGIWINCQLKFTAQYRKTAGFMYAYFISHHGRS